MTEGVQKWSSWIADFKKGETISAYFFIAGAVISVLAEVFLGFNLLSRIVFLITTIGLVGGLVDETAHLFVAGYTKGLSYSSIYSLLKSFIHFRPHVLIFLFISFGAILIELEQNYHSLFMLMFIVPVMISIAVGLEQAITARYYH